MLSVTPLRKRSSASLNSCCARSRPCLRDGNLLLGGFEIEHRFPDLLVDAAGQVIHLVVQPLQAALELLLFAVAVPVEQRDREGPLDLADSGHRAEVAAERAVISTERKRREIARPRGLLLFHQGIALGQQGAVIRPRLQCRMHGLAQVGRLHVLEFQLLGEFERGCRARKPRKRARTSRDV